TAEQLQPLERRAIQVGSAEIAVLEPSSVKVGVRQIRVPEADLGQVAAVPLGADQDEARQVGVGGEEVLEGGTGVVGGHRSALPGPVPLGGAVLQQLLDLEGLRHKWTLSLSVCFHPPPEENARISHRQ